MKKIFLTLLIAVTTIAISCEKQSIKPNESDIVLNDYDSNARNSNLGDVIELGATITKREADSRSARFASELSDLETDTYLSGDNYTELREFEGAKGIGHILVNSGELIFYPMDADNEIIEGLIFKGNSSGGVEIDTTTANDALDSFATTHNDPEIFPGVTTIGINILDGIADQEDFQGFHITNVLDLVEEVDYIDVTYQAYDSSNLDFGIVATDGAKDCRVWVPTHFIFGGTLGGTLVPGHYRPCTGMETIIWAISH